MLLVQPHEQQASPDFSKAYGLESNYLSPKRLASFGQQLAAVLELRPGNMLEVGKGPGLVSGALAAVGVKVVTLDLRPELKPDLVGSVLAIPSEDGAFDIAICCQVLEHLPFADFPRALGELRRVTRRALVLSVPDIRRHYFVRLRLPLWKDSFWSCSIPRRKKRGPKTPGHHWEIGFPGTSLDEVKKGIQASGWRIRRSWRVTDFSWHHFFLLEQARA